MSTHHDEIIHEVKVHYARAARTATAGHASCCEPDLVADADWGTIHYDELDNLSELPSGAVLASLGCGNPTAVAELRHGEVVLDLGSGGGIDVLLSARRVGSEGYVYGLDLTPEMVELARRNAQEAGVSNVEILEGRMEDIPLPDEAVDVVISNCVVNLSPDKPAVFAEIHRVLRPGGRLGISDVVTEDRLTDEERRQRGSFVSCLAGALRIGEYTRGLEGAGFVDVSITFTHEVADGVHSAIVRAAKPSTPPTSVVG
jgi:SAM-dependent methyltransferase